MPSRSARSLTWGADPSPRGGPAPAARSRGPPPPRRDRDVADEHGSRAGGKPGPLGTRGGRPLLDQRHEVAEARAVRAGAGLRRGEAAGLAAIGRALPRHVYFSLAVWPEWMVERTSERRSRLRWAPSRKVTRFS